MCFNDNVRTTLLVFVQEQNCTIFLILIVKQCCIGTYIQHMIDNDFFLLQTSKHMATISCECDVKPIVLNLFFTYKSSCC